LQVAAVTTTAAIILPEFAVPEDLLMALYRTGIMDCRTFLSGRIKIMYNCQNTKM
jgi:hypothetical protein